MFHMPVRSRRSGLSRIARVTWTLVLGPASVAMGRSLFLKETARKLAQLLHTPETVAQGLSERLADDESLPGVA